MHYFGKLDPNPYKSEKLHPNQHLTKIQEANMIKMESWRVVDAHNGGLEGQNDALEGL
jgi:hypothetical protein